MTLRRRVGWIVLRFAIRLTMLSAAIAGVDDGSIEDDVARFKAWSETHGNGQR